MLSIQKKLLIPLIVLFTILSLALIYVRPAYATEPNCDVWGNTKVFTWGGITATHKAGIEVAPWGSQQSVTGWAYIKTNQSIGANKIGAVAYLYNSAGLLVNSTKLIWNSSGEKDVGVGAATIASAGSRYYAGGLAYIQGTHNEYDPCSYSPTVTCSIDDPADPLLNAKEYATNENGQTYGSMVSSYSVGAKPDLVSAIGTNNREGYIYYEQWMNSIIASGTSQEAQRIPLYAKDGHTQIGVFELSDPIIS